MGELDSRYFASWLFHQWQLRIFENLCNRWIGQSAVKSDMLLALEFPLPLLAEQKRFAAELSQRLAVVGKVRLGIEEQLNEINELPVALLRKAFNGEL
jgi:restriction endonuclease S subunit